METIEEKKMALSKLARECWDLSTDAEDAPAIQRQTYSLKCLAGERLYRSFSDEELLDLLREAADRLGHSPAQKEVFWVYRHYIKRRFEKWPYALRRAGLSAAAGKGGVTTEWMRAAEERRRELLELVRARADTLGRVPHPGDFPEECRREFSRYYHTWNEVLVSAGVSRVSSVRVLEDLEPKYQAMLDAIRRQAMELGRAPLRCEVDEALRKPLSRRCGSWRNILYQIGLEPVVHISPFSSALRERPPETPHRHRTALYDCYYKVLDLDDRARSELEAVRVIAERMGRAPRRNEVPKELRRDLQESCGSWSNALFQLGLHRQYREGQE